MMCVHDVDLRDGDRTLTPAEAAAVFEQALVAAVQVAVRTALANVAVTRPATCTRCGAACIVEASLAVRDGAVGVETTLATMQ